MSLAVGLVIGGFVAYFRLTAAGWTWLDALLVSVVASAVSAMIGMVVLAISARPTSTHPMASGAGPNEMTDSIRILAVMNRKRRPPFDLTGEGGP